MEQTDRSGGARADACERFIASVRAELAQTDERMEWLKREGKVKTVTYRQLFANRSILKEIDRRLRDVGL